MADKSLKSITFPQLGNTYKIPELASNFSASTAYAAGDYVIYSGKLYRFTAAHSAGAWNAAHVTEAKLADEVSDLKTALRSGDEEDAEWHLGFYLDENGDLCQVDDE